MLEIHAALTFTLLHLLASDTPSLVLYLFGMLDM
jgi:hypothetical protein